MDYKKRAALYLVRKKGKTLILFILVFVISVFLVTSYSLSQAAEKFASDIRSSIGAAFYIRASTGVVRNQSGASEVIQNKIRITDEEVENILRCGEITNYNPMNYGYAQSDDIIFIPGDKDTEESNMGRVFALNFSALSSDFIDGTLALTEGRHIVEADSASIVISSSLAAANGLSIGDKVNLESAELGEVDGEYIDAFTGERKETSVVIVGLYDINQNDMAQTATAGVQENRIYASLDVLEKLNESEIGVYTGEVDFYVTDPAELQDIVSKVQEIPSIDWNTHFIRVNDFNYSQMADELLSLASLMDLLILCVSIVGLGILILVFALRMRERICEVGIMISVGISKKEIIKQFLTEIMIIMLIAFGISYLASVGIHVVLERTVLANFQTNLISDAALYSGKDEIIKIGEYFKLGIDRVGLVFIGEFFAILTAIFFSIVPIIRMQPREILTKLS